MRRFLLLIVVLLLQQVCTFAQPGIFSFNPEKNNVISLDAELQVNSNALTNQFIYDFYNSKYLNADEKTRMSNRLNDHNLFGYRLDAALTFRVSDTADRHSGFFGSLEHHDRMELTFDKEFFDLYFFGNAAYTGQSVQMDELGLNVLTYQQLKAGYFRSFGKERRQMAGVALGFCKGQRFLEVDVDQATLFTQQDAWYVELDADMMLRRSDTAMSDLKAFNGTGASLDVFYAFTDGHRNNFRIAVSNVGFIKWNNRTQQYARDTLYHFDGFEVKDILDVSSSTFSGKTKDSILNEFSFAGETKTYSAWLPLQLNVSYSRLFCKERFFLGAEVRHEFFYGFRPQTIIRPAWCYRWNESELRLGAILMVRGYGTFNAGAEITAKFADSFFVQVGSGFLNAYISPSKAAGIGGYFSIAKSF